MICYFSATGNSRHVASQIAAKTGAALLDIAECMKQDNLDITLTESENIGIVMPVYDWILPLIVDQFLDKVRIHFAEGHHYSFLVVTYGTTPGTVPSLVDAYMKKKGLPLNAMYTVQMPDTWTPIFDLSDAEEVKKINQQADLHIQDVVNRVVEKREGDFSQRRLPRIVAGLAREHYNRARMTRHLHVTDACIGCGLCMRNCPIQAIEMCDKKPVWVKEQCLMCLRCLHHCPKFAIQYDDRTQEHGQYVHL